MWNRSSYKGHHRSWSNNKSNQSKRNVFGSLPLDVISTSVGDDGSNNNNKTTFSILKRFSCLKKIKKDEAEQIFALAPSWKKQSFWNKPLSIY